ARQEGLLLQLEAYYRDAIPREKLFEQITSDVYVSDAQLWQIWKDTRDTAQISYIALRPEMLPDTAVTVPANEISDYYDKNKKDFERPAKARISVIILPRTISAADTAVARNRALGLRERIVKGAKFEDAAYALKVGDLSQPVLTPFGYRIIRVDERKGDTLSLKHILVRIQQSD